MPTAGFNPPQGNQSTAQLQDWIVKLCRDLEYYMNNLDTVNINRLDARVIIAASIIAGKLAANSVETDNLQAGAVTANKITVSQLSAITADMGHITAGDINVTTDMNIGRFLNLLASSSSGSKGIKFNDSGGTVAKIDVLSGDLGINTSGFITLTGGAGAYANGGRIATEGISVSFSVMGGDGITPMTLTFDGGTLSSVV